MREVFLDTVGVLALLDERDQWHTSAEVAWARIVANVPKWLTTTLVLAECANAAARRPYRAAVVKLRDSLNTMGAVVEPTPDEWELAWQNYAQGDSASAGVMDQVSFLVMRRFGLVHAFTNDRHFSLPASRCFFDGLK